MVMRTFVPGVGSKAAERATEEAFMRRKPVAKPTVKAVRDESRAKKAAVASKSTGKPGESMMARTEATRARTPMSSSRQPMVKAPMKSATNLSAVSPSPATFPKGKGSPSSSTMKRAERVADFKRGSLVPTKPNTPASAKLSKKPNSMSPATENKKWAEAYIGSNLPGSEQAESFRKPTSEEFRKTMKRRVGASNSPLGSLSRWMMRTGDKLFK